MAYGNSYGTQILFGACTLHTSSEVCCFFGFSSGHRRLFYININSSFIVGSPVMLFFLLFYFLLIYTGNLYSTMFRRPLGTIVRQRCCTMVPAVLCFDRRRRSCQIFLGLIRCFVCTIVCWFNILLLFLSECLLRCFLLILIIQLMVQFFFQIYYSFIYI